MLTLSTNTNNDLYLDPRGRIAMVRDIEAVLQTCEHVIKTRLGEYIYDTDRGIPYFETVWDGIPNLIQFEAAARSAILGVTGVTEVISFRSVVIDATLTYEAVIKTIYGVGTVNG